MTGKWESKPRLVDRQNRVALPLEAREALGVKAGDLVAFTVEGGVVQLHRVKWEIDQDTQ